MNYSVNFFDRTFGEKQSLLHKRKITLKKNRTKAELYISGLLNKMNVKFIEQKGFILGNFVIVDFYLPKYRLCIEVDGGYHETEKQKKRDKDKDNYLIKKRKFKVLRIKNELALEMNVDSLMCKINHAAFG